MVPGCFPFSPWSGTTPLGYQLQLPGINLLMILLDGVVVMLLENCGVLLPTFVWPNGWCFL
jgi:hypothetical protein